MYDTRRSWFHPFGALATTTVLGAALLASTQFARPSDAAVRHEPAPRPAPSAGVLGDDGDAPVRAQSGTVGVARESVTIRYTFDDGARRPITDVRGRYLLRPHAQNGGTISLVRQGKGLAVRYPSRCTLSREKDCPRAILEGFRDDNLNPGTRPLRYGASIMMTHSDLADGANVFQKGYSVGGGSQFKLQVDHKQGHPSCVVAGRAHIYRAEPRVDVADGRWHRLVCTRTANRLTLTVDGVERAAVPVPRKLSIANAAPLRVGGKGANKGNDQFAGQIDDVFLTIR